MPVFIHSDIIVLIGKKNHFFYTARKFFWL